MNKEKILLGEGPIYMCRSDVEHVDIDVTILSQFGCGQMKEQKIILRPVEDIIEVTDENGKDITEQFKEQFKGKRVCVIPNYAEDKCKEGQEKLDLLNTLFERAMKNR